jgi:hypothetical protein
VFIGLEALLIGENGLKTPAIGFPADNLAGTGFKAVWEAF